MPGRSTARAHPGTPSDLDDRLEAIEDPEDHRDSEGSLPVDGGDTESGRPGRHTRSLP
jgi:hypothetical protein